jgi:hypothetical protein
MLHIHRSLDSADFATTRTSSPRRSGRSPFAHHDVTAVICQWSHNHCANYPTLPILCFCANCQPPYCDIVPLKAHLQSGYSMKLITADTFKKFSDRLLQSCDGRSKFLEANSSTPFPMLGCIGDGYNKTGFRFAFSRISLHRLTHITTSSFLVVP